MKATKEISPETVQPAVTRRARLFVALARMPRPVRYLAALVLGALSMVGGMASSFADGTDPGTTGVQSLFSGAQTSVGTILIPAVVTIVLLGSLFWLGLTWFKKGKNKGNS